MLLKLNPAVTVYFLCSHDHRNVAEVDWCYVAASSGKVCSVNVSKIPVSTNIEVLLGICQKSV